MVSSDEYVVCVFWLTILCFFVCTSDLGIHLDLEGGDEGALLEGEL